MPTRPVLLLDVYSLFYRAYFALPRLSTRAGEATAGVYGFAALLLKLFREEHPRGAALALDLPGPTFRHARYPAYKGVRPAGPDSGQTARLRQLIDALGLPAFAVPGFEADDILATLAREIEGDVVVVSGDRDCLQLAGGPVSVLLVSRGATEAARYDEAAVRKRFGVAPARLPDYQALVGDPSDNLPGVAGVGPRTATRLLELGGDGVEELLGRLAEVRPARLAETLAAEADRLRLWADLTRLREDVPLPPGPRFGAVSPDARARVLALFEELEFFSLIPRAVEWLVPE